MTIRLKNYSIESSKGRIYDDETDVYYWQYSIYKWDNKTLAKYNVVYSAIRMDKFWTIEILENLLDLPMHTKFKLKRAVYIE